MSLYWREKTSSARSLFVVKEPVKDTTLSESETFINLRWTLVHNVFIFVIYKTSEVVLI